MFVPDYLDAIFLETQCHVFFSRALKGTLVQQGFQGL